MCCTTLYSSALIFPVASVFMCICELHVFIGVLLSHQAGSLLVPRRKGSKPHLKLFHCIFWGVFTTACDFLYQTYSTSCPQSKVFLLIQSHRQVMTTLSFLKYLAGLFFSFDDFTHCCYASLPVAAFCFNKCEFSIFPVKCLQAV